MNLSSTTRKCRVCEETKPLLEGYYRSRPDPTLPSSYSYECKVCARHRVKITSDPDKRKDQHLRRKYNISLNDYTLMLEQQNYKCWVCDAEHGQTRTQALNVDHDHTTGEVRGLLCNRCNFVLGEVKDNTRTLEKLILYLEHNGRNTPNTTE